VFSKDGLKKSQLQSLVLSVKRLPSSWPSEKPEETKNLFKKILGFPISESWAVRAWEDIQECHPPIHELSKWSHGLAVLRWLLHRILPYPCFLMNSIHLAARLRITHDSLLKALAQNDRFNSLWESVHYKGVLDEFLGKRWWRTGIESLLWKLTEGNSFNPEKIKEKIVSETGCELEPIEIIQPVICLNKDFQEMENACSSEQAIRIQPDDWPPYADQAWTSIELAKREPALGALVIGQDKELLVEPA
jgi:hypothetical protein